MTNTMAYKRIKRECEESRCCSECDFGAFRGLDEYECPERLLRAMPIIEHANRLEWGKKHGGMKRD